MTASATCCIDSRMVHRGLLDPAEGGGLGQPVLRLQNALGPVDQLAGLQPLGEIGDLLLQGLQLGEAGDGHLDGRDHIALAERLHQIRHRPRVPGPLDQLALGEGGQHQDGGDTVGRDPLGGGDAVENRHLHIEDDEVGAVLLGKRDSRLTIARLADDGVPLLLEHLLQVEADERLVLGDDDAGRQRWDVRLRVGGVSGAHCAPRFPGRWAPRAYLAAVRWTRSGSLVTFETASPGSPIGSRQWIQNPYSVGSSPTRGTFPSIPRSQGNGSSSLDEVNNASSARTMTTLRPGSHSCTTSKRVSAHSRSSARAEV